MLRLFRFILLYLTALLLFDSVSCVCTILYLPHVKCILIELRADDPCLLTRSVCLIEMRLYPWTGCVLHRSTFNIL